MLGIYIYLLLLYCENKRYTNPCHKINTVIREEMREKIIIDFSIKESIYTNKIYPEYSKELIYFDRMY